MSSVLLPFLLREYYLCEAMAVYERYYDAIRNSAANVASVEFLDHPNRTEDRPLTWVPLVFHCTDFESFEGIVEAGRINGPVSLTELPIVELDRMKIRGKGAPQVAIGFPRAYLETLGCAPVFYTKHHAELQRYLEEHPDVLERLAPFIALGDDVAAFQEIKTERSIPIEKAVWILTTERNQSGAITIPKMGDFARKFGRISQSYWHRTHQMGILNEWQYIRFTKHEGRVVEFDIAGEFYWRSRAFEPTQLEVKMPAGRNFKLRFDIATSQHAEYDGPLRFLDVAARLKAVIKSEYSESALPYALIPDLPAMGL